MNTIKRITLVAMLGVLLSFAFANQAQAARVDVVSPASPACEFQNYDPDNQYPTTRYACTVAAPVTFELTTPRSSLDVRYCGPPDVIGGVDVCDPTVISQSGPDGLGNYHYFVRLVAAPIGNENILVVGSDNDRARIDLNITDNGIDPFGELEYVAREVQTINGGKSCRISSRMSYYMLDLQVWTTILKLQKRRDGKWRTVKRAGSVDSWPADWYLRQRRSVTVKVAKSDLQKGAWRTKVHQEVDESEGWPSGTTYHLVRQTDVLTPGMCK